jgi:acetyl esterase/lipase
MKTITRILTFFLLALSSLHFLRVNSTRTAQLGLFKMLSGALAPYLAVVSAIGALGALLLRDPWAGLAGVAGAFLAGRHVWRVIAPHTGLERAFGGKPLTPRAGMLARRWSWKLPATPEPRWDRDVVFWRIPGGQRDLLCDIWQPPVGVLPSGLALIFYHGSGWHFMDKDFGTRPFFRHLAAQGHVIMDVAYRLCPETDFDGMIADAKRAVAWMKTNAPRYGADPHKIVVMGASAGGHLALLCAYTPQQPDLTPAELCGHDLSVKAVVSYYGPSDMRAYHAQAGRALGYTDHDVPPGPPGLMDRVADWIMKNVAKVDLPAVSHRQMMKNLLGGQPDEVPERYDLASPIHYVSPAAPPTLLLQGEHDQLVPVEAARALYHKLLENNVPAVYVEFPQTEHAFDVAFQAASQNSPAAQAALYDVERFLAANR